MDSRSVLKNGFNNNENVIFLSGEDMDHVKDVLRMMLSDFESISQKYSINYTLGGGSALGAVRHGGIIPWDDDVDINIPRRDFNKLLRVMHKYRGKKYTLYCPEIGANHGLGCAQLKLNGTVYKSFNELSKKESDCGICIDLFVIENTYNNVVLRYFHGFLCLIFGYLLTCRKTYEDISYIEDYVDIDSEAYKRFKTKARIGGLVKFISLDHLGKLTAKVYSMCTDDNSQYVTVPTGRKHFFGELYHRPILCESRRIVFDNVETNVTKYSEEYLSTLYGKDYMVIPKEGKHEQHPLMGLDFGKY